MRRNRCASPLAVLSPTRLAAAAVVLGLAAAATPAAAAVFFPSKTADTLDGACAADCSLREAVVAANGAAGAGVIVLGPGTYTLTRAGAGEDAAATGDLDVTSDLTILGAGAATTIVDGGGLDRVFDVAAGVHLELIGITVQNGSVADASGGGAIRSAGALTLTRSVVQSSRAPGGAGGGILSSGNSATAAITASTIAGNSAHDGGGIAAHGTLSLLDSTVSGNTAANIAGGVYLYSQAAAVLGNDTIAGNAAADAGGAFSEGAAFLGPQVTEFRNTILAGNIASKSATHHPDCLGSAFSGGYNLVGDPTGCLDFQPAKHDLIGAVGAALDPHLGPLAANGGPTPTQAPGAASPAIAGGNPAAPGGGGGACEAADQRGEARGSGGAGRCDVGAVEATGGCLPDARTLCLNRNRFRVTAHWTTAAASGDGEAVALTADTGYFWFFDPANVEVTVKVLDACQAFDRYWAFLSGLTNVKVDVTVVDTASGKVKTYGNPQGQVFVTKLDANAFAACP